MDFCVRAVASFPVLLISDDDDDDDVDEDNAFASLLFSAHASWPSTSQDKLLHNLLDGSLSIKQEWLS